MLKTNEKIVLTGDEAIEILKEVEIMLISLHKIGAHFAETDYDGTDKTAFDSETNRFIGGWRVTERLAKIRRILGEKFDDTLGDDDMDDTERAMEGLNIWRSPNSKP